MVGKTEGDTVVGVGLDSIGDGDDSVGDGLDSVGDGDDSVGEGDSDSDSDGVGDGVSVSEGDGVGLTEAQCESCKWFRSSPAPVKLTYATVSTVTVPLDSAAHEPSPFWCIT